MRKGVAWQDIKLGFYVGVGLFAFSIVATMLVKVVKK